MRIFPSLDSLYKSTKTALYNFLKKIRPKRAYSAKGSRKRGAIASQSTGRNTRIVPFEKGENLIAPIYTVLNSVANGNYDLIKKTLSISGADLVGWKRLEHESLTLILLVDVSNSTWPFIKVFKGILESLATYFSKHNDRVGLISLQGLQAKIYSHPTHNLRVVARGLGKLEFHGETPLADGLLKSLSVAMIERGKNPGSKSVVILLSDCYPEPLTPGYRSALDDPAYKNCITAAGYYRKQKTTLLIIDPAFTSEKAKFPGEILSESLARVSGGRLIKLKRPKERMHLPPSKREIDGILKGIEQSFVK